MKPNATYIVSSTFRESRIVISQLHEKNPSWTMTKGCDKWVLKNATGNEVVAIPIEMFRKDVLAQTTK